MTKGSKMFARNLGRSCVVLAGLACLAPNAWAATYGTQTATADGVTASGKGTLTVAFTTAKNDSSVKMSASNGRPGYTEGYFWSAKNSIKVRSSNSTSTSWTTVSRSGKFSAPTAGPWSAKGKTCVDRRLKVDTCSGWSAGARA